MPALRAGSPDQAVAKWRPCCSSPEGDWQKNTLLRQPAAQLVPMYLYLYGTVTQPVSWKLGVRRWSSLHSIVTASNRACMTLPGFRLELV